MNIDRFGFIFQFHDGMIWLCRAAFFLKEFYECYATVRMTIAIRFCWNKIPITAQTRRFRFKLHCMQFRFKNVILDL